MKAKTFQNNDILIVDNESSNLHFLAELLEKEGYQVRPAEKAKTALDSAQANPPGLIMLNVRMPDMDGFELCRRLKQDKRTRNVPIIFISPLQDTEARIQGFEAGGMDFITKPFMKPEILARVRTHIHLYQLQQQLQQQIETRAADLNASKELLKANVDALEISENRFELALAGSAAGIWDWDIVSDKVYYSDRFIQLLGYSPEESWDTTDEFWNRLHPDDVESVQLALDQHLEEHVSFRVDFRLQTSSGIYRWYYSRAQALWDNSGKAIRMSGSIIDITVRKQAEEKTCRSEERFRNLMEQSPLDIVIMTPEGQISEVNDAWIRNWEVQADEVDKFFKEYNIRNDIQFENLGLAPLVERAFAGENIVLPPVDYLPSHELENLKLEKIKARRRWVQCHLFSIKDKNGNVESVVGINMDITERKQVENELRDAYEEIKKFKEQLEFESAYLKDEIKVEHNFENIIGNGEALKYVLHRIEQVSPTDSPVLIMGETGTGKELMARALHELSPQNKRAMVKVNCAALPRELIESELFGREKGAFTGATTTQPGRFELAMGSTLFLDEIGELPIDLQPKLLRAIESGEFERLGNSRTLHSDARIIAATNRELEEEVLKGRFREDLWYRLKVFPITVPPLRERPDDIPLLVKWYVDQITKKMGKSATKINKRAMQKLQSYPWPGNVRELMHVIEVALITSQGEKLNFELPRTENTELTDFISFEAMERDYILQVLKAKNWKIGGKNSAASVLGMHVNTLRGRMEKLGIKKP